MQNHQIIGDSPQIKKVIETAEKIAQKPAVTTLIVGENGTGKELVARLIHNLSESATKPFIDINCGAIPETLLESELFGFEKGAFTNAYATKMGLLELAHEGSIFLDEISAMPLNLQSKLLKAVESKTIRRVGGVTEIKVETRIIAASNIDLIKAVQEGRFREDLYYRLNIGHIFVPPLRDRGDDVVLLANHFINYYNYPHKQKIQGLTEAATKLLKDYTWPGNVRQLQNTIARAILLETEDWIDTRHLFMDQRIDIDGETMAPSQPDLKNLFKIPTKGISLEELERTIITSALEKARGNLSQAARLFKISRGKLRYRLEKLDIVFND